MNEIDSLSNSIKIKEIYNFIKRAKLIYSSPTFDIFLVPYRDI